ncbi:MAG: SDR family NAD(P)-dependent oxidoreductase, partial [Planctomycetaceae bacterium]|nr:SDR family NAD(P)-dependent oxidoreductase [Planctomycetaceae bacterium]
MTQDLFSIKDRVTLVSGGSRGIGLAIAQGFADRGARVIITGREHDTLEPAAQAMSSSENTVEFEVCDVADVNAIR